jgi:hypothetical protein
LIHAFYFDKKSKKWGTLWKNIRYYLGI